MATPQPPQPRPLGPADALPMNFTPEQRRIDQARRSPSQQEAQAALRALVGQIGGITEAQWAAIMSDASISDYWPIVQQVTAGEPAPRAGVDQARREHWRHYVDGLAPDSPRAKWYDYSIGAAKRQQLYERYVDMPEPPLDWAGG
jgi:hypothetical protein